jgi:hypothetical protein
LLAQDATIQLQLRGMDPNSFRKPSFKSLGAIVLINLEIEDFPTNDAISIIAEHAAID